MRTIGSGAWTATRRLSQLVVVVAVGVVFASAAGFADLTGEPVYLYGVTTLLAIGLYASASGIPREAVEDLRLLLVAVTLGVLFKAALIAGVMFLVIREPIALVLAVAVAQIDPLSVAAMTGRSRLSPRAQTLLRAWSSFDDPITALLLLYMSTLALSWSGVAGHVTGAPAGADAGSYLLNLLANLGFAAGCLFVWAVVRWAVRRRTGSEAGAGSEAGGRMGAGVVARHPATAFLLLVVLLALVAFAVMNYLMLGIALVGLFFRPLAPGVVDRVTGVALVLAGFALGLVLVGGADPVLGGVLGFAAFGSQIVVGYALTRRLSPTDRGYLVLGQQNGITAIVLSLTLEPAFPGAVRIVAPAILTVNVLHIVSNALWARRLAAATALPATPAPEPVAPRWRRAQR